MRICQNWSDEESNNDSYQEESETEKNNNDEDVTPHNDGDDDEETTPESENNNLCAYELLQQRNIEEQRARLKEIMQAKSDLFPDVPKPKKPRTQRKPKAKTISEYSLRKDPKKNIKYTE